MKKLLSVFLITSLLGLVLISCSNSSGGGSNGGGISRSEFVAQIGTYNYTGNMGGEIKYGKDVVAYLSGTESGTVQITGLTPSSTVKKTIEFIKFSYTFTDYDVFSAFKSSTGNTMVSDGIKYNITYNTSTYTATCTNSTTTTQTVTYSEFVDSLFPSNGSVIVTESESGSIINIIEKNSSTDNGLKATMTEKITATLQ